VSHAGGRSRGLDVARGLAVLLMLQTHAYDAWVAPTSRSTFAFGLTRVLGTLPLPMFLAISGYTVGLRAERSARLGLSRGQLQGALALQGLRVLGAGYALNLVFALLDGFRGLETFLRIDVLHAIGLSIVALSACLGLPSRRFAGPGPREAADASLCLASFRRRALLLGLFALASCPLLTRLAALFRPPLLRYLAAPFVELAGLSSMPLIPLVSFAAGFAVVGTYGAFEPASPRRLTMTCLLAALGLLLGSSGVAFLEARGIPLRRSEISVWFNALDLAGRAAVALAATLWLSRDARDDLPLLSRLGRHSMLAYGFHLPLCYGRLAIPWKRALSMPWASAALAVLVVAVWLVVSWRERKTASVARGARHAVSWGS
jgi:uncharacterized membrane protein